ncbi:tyrosine-type recombinase/integrase [Sphingomonas xinjiangensis]|uniref:Integrase n=1 Tax=Sphingomonas xinjiangensis TaxID=643568 RepID=A0A840YKW2_9SPHN|nr:tyrosine-type recombinase/integrase [Sphingomonas xinjiangensis]MBB5711868.1 integrase [Sphingomonas xinjiangensis]
MAESQDRELADILVAQAVVAAAPPRPEIQRRNQFRGELLRAAFGPEVRPSEVHERIVTFAGAASPNTLRALLSDLRVVDAFQRRYARPALPIAPRALHLLIAERADAGAAKSSIDRLVASMVRLHSLLQLPSPVDDIVRWKQQEIRRSDTRPVRQALGLRLKGDVSDVLRGKPQPLSLLQLLEHIPGDLAGLRDRALIAVGYDAGLRASELVPIDLSHIKPATDGEASLFIPRSKTDQESEGGWAWLSARSVRHLNAWIKVAKIAEGHVFRPLSYRVGARGHLGEGTVSRILKSRLRQYLGDLVERGTMTGEEAATIVAQTSAHSVRVGCDQDLFAAGVDIGAVMQALRWTSPRQPLAYARHLAPATSKAAALMRRVR